MDDCYAASFNGSDQDQCDNWADKGSWNKVQTMRPEHILMDLTDLWRCAGDFSVSSAFCGDFLRSTKWSISEFNEIKDS